MPEEDHWEEVVKESKSNILQIYCLFMSASADLLKTGKIYRFF
jgi:hypothetical protein